jgi:hypothetical protein
MIEVNLQEVGVEKRAWLFGDWLLSVCNEHSGFLKGGEFLKQLSD